MPIIQRTCLWEFREDRRGCLISGDVKTLWRLLASMLIVTREDWIEDRFGIAFQRPIQDLVVGVFPRDMAMTGLKDAEDQAMLM
jgi:hypothetical protein